MPDTIDIIVAFVKGIGIPLIPLTLIPGIILFERKIIGWVQQRPGPNRVGPWGSLQSVADAVKLIFKEDMMPVGANKVLFQLAPAIVVLTSFLTLAIVPFGPRLDFGEGRVYSMSILDIDLALILFLSISSLGVYGIMLGSWSSNSKYSLIGGLRSSAQMVSYEINLSFTLASILILVGSFGVYEIVAAQEGGIMSWFIWQQPLVFLLFFIAQIAETNRLPFDLPEGESELTGGFHTEYTGMKFAMFFLAEYSSMIVMAALVAVLFLGGFHSPIHVDLAAMGVEGIGLQILNGVGGFFWIMLKIVAQLFFMIWMRATLPRMRYDQLMSLGWKVMFELATLNLIYTAVVVLLVPKGSPGFELGRLGGMNLQGVILAAAGFATILALELAHQIYRRRTLNVT